MSGLAQPLLYPGNVKLGVVDFSEAPVGTAWNDKSGLWAYLGVLEKDTFKNDFSRKTFEFKSGVPLTTKALYVTDLTGKVSGSLTEINQRTMTMVAGGVPASRTYGTVATTASSTPAQSTAAGVTTFSVTAATGLLVGMNIEVMTNAPIDGGLESVFITGISGTAVSVMPALVGNVTATSTVKNIAHTKNFVGTSTVRKMSYLGIFTAEDNSQVVVHIPQASSTGLKPEFSQTKNMMLPFTLECYGVVDTTLAPAQPVVAYLYELDPTQAI